MVVKIEVETRKTLRAKERGYLLCYGVLKKKLELKRVDMKKRGINIDKGDVLNLYI